MLKQSLCLVQLRIAFLILAFVHLVLTAVVTLNIDVTVDEDPKVRAYHHIRWKLITCWFNLLTLAYLPARIYCEWKIYQDDEDSLVKKLNHCTDVVFTAILLPVTLFSDVFFWIIFSYDPAMLGPPRILVYLPHWVQHSLHTVSFLVTLLDLVLTPRMKPKTTIPRIALLMAFSFSYIYVLLSSYTRGVMVYQLFENMNILHLTIIFTVSIILLLVLFSVQWIAIEKIWGRKYINKVS